MDAPLGGNRWDNDWDRGVATRPAGGLAAGPTVAGGGGVDRPATTTRHPFSVHEETASEAARGGCEGTGPLELPD